MGKPTIGFGHLIKKKEKFLHQKKYSKKYLSAVFENDFNLVLNDFNKNYNVKNLPKNLQEVLLEIIFQLGIKNCLKFKNGTFFYCFYFLSDGIYSIWIYIYKNITKKRY